MKMTGRVWVGVLLIVIGFLFVMDEYSSFHISKVMFSLWPVLLVAGGVALIMRGRRRQDELARQTAPLADIGLGQRVEETATPGVRLWNIFGDIRSRVTSHVFTGGSISTVLGRAVIDLTAASLAPGEHTLKMDSVIGSLHVRIPKGMAYAITADGVVGSIRAEEGSRNGFFPSIHCAVAGYREATHRIHLDLSTVIGEVRVSVIGE